MNEFGQINSINKSPFFYSWTIRIVSLDATFANSTNDNQLQLTGLCNFSKSKFVMIDACAAVIC